MARIRVLLVLLLTALLLPATAAPVRPGAYRIKSTVVSVKGKPAYGSETVTQAVMGEAVTVVKVQGGWARITLPDQMGYPGWIDTAHIVPARPRSSTVAVVLSARTALRSSPGGATSGEVVMGTVLDVSAPASDGWVAVVLPDGTPAFVDARAVSVETPGSTSRTTPDHITRAAQRLVGTAYLWGGMSAKGVDCSGFTHMVYRVCGIPIHRDADQQYDNDGTPVSVSELVPGDLLYFRTYLPTVSHCGIYLGGGRFIHASSRTGVTVADLQSYSDRYVGARRVLKP